MPFAQEIGKLSTTLLNAMRQVLASISTVWAVEHDTEGTHTDVTATSVSTAALASGGTNAITVFPVKSDRTLNLYDTTATGTFSLSGTTAGTRNVCFVVRPNVGREGWIQFTENNVADRWVVGIRNADAALYVESGNATTHTSRFAIDTNTTAAETTLQVSVAGGSLQRVSVGAADSGGAGYRVLRVPN